MYELETPPDGVSNERWHGEAAVAPEVGDLWLISWNGEALALAVLASTRDTFTLCWPVTLSDAPVFAPALEVPSTLLDVPLLVWPTRETGIGLHMLHRRLGRLLTAKTMSLIDVAVETGGRDFPLPLASYTVDGEEAERESDEMVDRWERICLNTWPEIVPGSSPFNADAFREAHLYAGDLAGILGITVPAAVSLVRGESVPSAAQLEMVAVAIGRDAEALLDAGSDAGARLLVQPVFKESLVELARIREFSEADARNLARGEFALAARSDGDDRARLQATIDRLREG